MSKQRFPEREIDRLFAGHTPADGDLARLAPIVAALKRDASAVPAADRVDAMAQALAAESRTDAAVALRGKARKVDARVRTGRRRLVTVSAVAAVAVVGIGGTAVAADSAAPGDLLYGVDQAFEAVGIGDGGTTERLREATRMANRGSTDRALAHAAEALSAEGEVDGAVALEEAASVVADRGAEQSAEVRSAVSDMLDWMATTDSRGRDFGQGVSERAHGIRDSASRGDDGSDPQPPGDEATPDDDKMGGGRDKRDDDDPDEPKDNAGDEHSGRDTNDRRGNR